MQERHHVYWLICGLILLLGGAIGRNIVITTLGLVLVGTVGVSWLWSRYALRGIRFHRKVLNPKIFPGESTEIEMEVTNLKPLPIPELRIREYLDRSLIPSGTTSRGPYGSNVHIWHHVSIGPLEKVRWRYKVTCTRRGYYRVGPILMKTSDPLGFFDSESHVPATSRILVYPRLVPIEQLAPQYRLPFEGSKTTPGVIVDPSNVVGARPFVPEDTRRQIHWRATARSSQLQSKIWRPLQAHSMVICLNLEGTTVPWVPPDIDSVELGISVAATLINQASQSRWACGLIVNSLHPGTWNPVNIRPSRDQKAFMNMMEILAKIPAHESMKFTDVLARERRQFPQEAIIVVITCVMTPGIEEQIHINRALGREVIVIDPKLAVTNSKQVAASAITENVRQD